MVLLKCMHDYCFALSASDRNASLGVAESKKWLKRWTVRKGNTGIKKRNPPQIGKKVKSNEYTTVNLQGTRLCCFACPSSVHVDLTLRRFFTDKCFILGRYIFSCLCNLISVKSKSPAESSLSHHCQVRVWVSAYCRRDSSRVPRTDIEPLLTAKTLHFWHIEVHGL